MANASVEKLKALGLRQGEKFVVGIAATIFMVCVGVFFTKPTITTTPAELQKKAEGADSNLNRKQEPEAILARIEEAGIKDPGFVKIVEGQSANALKPGDFRPRLDWVTPEPGAGLIRDQPEVVAPTELAVFPGRGGMLLYQLDDKKHRIVDEAAAKAGSGGRQMRSGGGMSSGGAPPAEKSAEAKRQQEAEAKAKQRLLAGSADAAKKADEPAKKADEPAPDAAVTGPFKEEDRGKRWVVITGVVDNLQMNKNWLEALKNPAIAFPQYHKVAAERQIRQSDGQWSEWAAVDEDAKFDVLDNMPEGDEELVPAPMRPEALVDPLPFLRAGYWTGVHVARLVPADALKVAEKAPDSGMRSGSGRPGGSSEAGMGRGGPMGGMSRGGEQRPGMGSEGGVSGGSGSGGDAGGGDEPVTPNTEPTLMLRSLDFAVDPNTTYRYRVRLVVKNPNFQRSDVNPGVDTVKEFLVGPWSEPTIAVSVPADVSAYAQIAAQDARRDDVVSFQVVRWDPNKGQTVVKTDDASPGFLIGEYGGVLMPQSEGGGAKSETVDFNSHSFVLDVTGGRSKIPDIGFERTLFTVPAVAMVVEPDGAVVIRSQARDKQDQVRQDMELNYDQAIKDSGKKRERGSGSMRSGMGQGSGKSRGGRRGRGGSGSPGGR